MQNINFLRIVIFLFLVLIKAPAFAAAGDEFQLIVENDTWSHTDRYYTNGIKFGVGRKLDALREPTEGLLRWLTPGQDDSVEFGLFAGQNLYTPKNIKIAAPQPFDRPWAAWLYLGGVAQVAREKSRLDTVEIDLGAVGPAAGGRWVQTGWHDLIGAPQPQGWDNQLPNEPAFLVSYLQKRRYGTDDFDIVPHAGITVGTVMTLGRVGATLRLGHNIGGFGVDTIEPGGVILQNTHSSEEHRKNRSEWFVFLGVDHRLVAHNIFLDGTVFHDSASVGRRPHVYDLDVGLSARFGAVRVSITRVRRSEEFYTAAGGGGVQFFHSINLGIEL
ncbi:MAG: lipid A deacylase LpxR family protein [Burkholderiales bacterium]